LLLCGAGNPAGDKKRRGAEGAASMLHTAGKIAGATQNPYGISPV
jgi:hypothetical protein